MGVQRSNTIRHGAVRPKFNLKDTLGHPSVTSHPECPRSFLKFDDMKQTEELLENEMGKLAPGDIKLQKGRSRSFRY